MFRWLVAGCVGRYQFSSDQSSFGERHKTVLEDACWQQAENNAQHINLAELDAVLKNINLALQWQGKVLHMKTYSVCIYHWVSDTNWQNASAYQDSK